MSVLRKEKEDYCILYVWGKSGLHSEFEASKGYIAKPFLKQQQQKGISREIKLANENFREHWQQNSLLQVNQF